MIPAALRKLPRWTPVLFGAAALVVILFLFGWFIRQTRCTGERTISYVGETDGYIVMDDYIAMKFGRGDCIRVIEKESGAVVFQEQIPESLEAGQIGTAGKTLVARFEKNVLSIDMEKWHFK